jgi:hypothetical protein
VCYVRGSDGGLRPATRDEVVGTSQTARELQRTADQVVPPHLKGLAFKLTDDSSTTPAPSTPPSKKRKLSKERARPTLLSRVFPCEGCNHVSRSFNEAKRHRKTHIEEEMSAGSSEEDVDEWGRVRGGGGRRRRRENIEEDDAPGPFLRSRRRALQGRRALGFHSVGSAHNQQLQRLRYVFPPRVQFMEQAFAHVMPRLAKVLQLQLAANRGLNIKCTIVLNVEMVKIDDHGEIEEEMEVPLRGGMQIIRCRSELIPAMQAWMERIDDALDTFIKRGSGWTLNDVNYLDVELFRVAPLQGACHLHGVDYKKGKVRFIDPPVSATFGGGGKRVKKIVMGTKNEEEASDPRLTDCFYLAVARACLGQDNFERAGVRNRFILDELNKFPKRKGKPIRECDVVAFEAAHDSLKLAVNVLYQNEEGSIFPLIASNKNATDEYKVIVLMLRYYGEKRGKDQRGKKAQEEHDHQQIGHYAYVSDPSSLLAIRKSRRPTNNQSSAASTTTTTTTTSTTTTTPAAAAAAAAADDDDDDDDGEGGGGGGGSFTTTKVHVCYNCFNYFYRQSTYALHIRWCHTKNGQAVVMPEPNTKVSFDEHKGKSFLAAYTIFFDFETYGKPPPDERHACRCTEAERRRADDLPPLNGDREAPDTDEEEDVALLLDAGLMKKKERPYKACPHKTRVLNEQKAFAYSLVVVNRHNKVMEHESYSGEDAAEVFLSRLLALERKYLLDFLKEGKGAPITAETRAQAGPRPENPFHPCYICESPLMGDCCLDHDHVDGSFLGWAHNSCNLHRKEVMKLPVLAHNFSSFDGHLIMREVPKVRNRRVDSFSARDAVQTVAARPPRGMYLAAVVFSRRQQYAANNSTYKSYAK